MKIQRRIASRIGLLLVAAISLAAFLRWNRYRPSAVIAPAPIAVQQPAVVEPPPTVEIRLVSDRFERDKVFVSNLHPVSAVVTVHGRERDAQQTDSRTTRAIELMLREIPSHHAATAIVKESGVSTDATRSQFYLTFEVPPDADFVADRARAKVHREQQNERSRMLRTGGNDQTARMLEEREPQIVAALRDAFHGNRTGMFEVMAVYRVQRPGMAAETMGSEPVRFEVSDDGDYFDQAAFR